MNKEPDNRDLAREFAVLEEKMKTHEARIEAIHHAIQSSIERGNAAAAKRDLALILTIVGLLVAGIAIQGFVLN